MVPSWKNDEIYSEEIFKKHAHMPFPVDWPRHLGDSDEQNRETEHD